MAPSSGVFGGRAATDLGVKPRGWGFHLPTCMKIQRPPRHRACPSSKGVFPDQSPRCNPTSGFRAEFLHRSVSPPPSPWPPARQGGPLHSAPSPRCSPLHLCAGGWFQG